MKRKKVKGRSQVGMGSIELAITSVVGVIFTCVAMDLGVMMFGNQVLDRATRDAARAAASQTTAANAKQAALAALATHKTDGQFIGQPTLKVDEFVFQDYGGTPAGKTNPATGQIAQEPFVNVTATTQVLLPANVSMFAGGLNLQQGPLATGKMDFRRTYYFPIVSAPLNANFGGND